MFEASFYEFAKLQEIKESEEEISREMAEQMITMFKASDNLVEKYRVEVFYEGKIWEIDFFTGDNQGLIIAEIELESEDEEFSKPPFIGEEVTEKREYKNVNLMTNPYRKW